MSSHNQDVYRRRFLQFLAGSPLLAYGGLEALGADGPKAGIKLPDPAEFNTLTAMIRTSLATPLVVPPSVPESWVPCPLSSAAVPPGVIASNPVTALPPNSSCV